VQNDKRINVVKNDFKASKTGDIFV